MLTFAISSLPFAPLFPPHLCRMLPNGANSLFNSTPSPTAARHMRPPGVELGAQAWEACMLPLYYGRHDTSQETRQWLLAIAPLPFLLSLSQTTQRCSQTSDSEGIRTPAGRAQWISDPSPWPLGRTVMLVPASHIHQKVYASRPHRAHCQSSQSKHICMTMCICISRESNPDHIDGNDVFCHWTTDAAATPCKGLA